ncbi:MAG: ABC transporter permease [Acidimicrobiales bacterium]
MSDISADAPSNVQATRARFDLIDFMSRFGVIVTLLGCVVFFSTQDDRFLSMANMRTTLAIGSPLLILALGLTVVLAMGDFDLSIAGMSSAAGATVVVLIVNHGWGWGWAVLVAVGFGIIAGAINGYLVAYIGTPSFITTLATGIVLAGIQVTLTDNRFITGAGEMADSYRDLGVGKPEPLTEFSSPVWIAAGLAIILWLFLAKTEVGRYMYAIGGNQEAARLAGIRVKLLRAAGFVVVSLTAVIAAVVETARTASTIPNSADSLLLPAFAAAFLGAAASRRGQFNVWGTVLGVIFLKVVDSGLTFMGYEQDIQNIAQGSILVGAMLLSRLGASRR